MGSSFNALTLAEIQKANSLLIKRNGGLGIGFLNAASLEYALEEIVGSMFGKELCPTVYDKAATLGWRIIKGHVFIDGNKRTGIFAAIMTLRFNRVEVAASEDELKGVALAIANGEMSIEEFADFLRGKS